MARVLVEFINTCPSCDSHEKVVLEAAAKYGDAVDCRVYHAGREFGYIPRYGSLTRGTLVIDGRTRIEELSRATIEAAIDEAVKRAGLG